MRPGLNSPQVGVVWPRRGDVRDAFGPLWADGTVQVLQLTVEQVFRGELDAPFIAALDRAAHTGCLVGHAVHASPFSPRDAITRDWLKRTTAVLERWPVRWLTDHYGCCRADQWHAAPLPLPASQALVDRVVDHLTWVHDAIGVPVGLENLALALCKDDVLVQPDLLEAMLEPVDGVLLLDLHNLWCQAVNFGLDPIGLMERYPLHRVKQIHIAGGRWSDFPAGRFRRDTHDGAVPEEVWALVPEALHRCENLEVVMLERLRGTVEDGGALAAEAVRLANALARPSTPTAGIQPPDPAPWRANDSEVADLLFQCARAEDFAPLQARVPGWATDPRALAVASEVTHKWGKPTA